MGIIELFQRRALLPNPLDCATCDSDMVLEARGLLSVVSSPYTA